MPFPQRDSVKLEGSGAPKDMQERIVTDRDGAYHREYFMNGSWRHNSAACKVRVNKDCKRE